MTAVKWSVLRGDERGGTVGTAARQRPLHSEQVLTEAALSCERLR